MTGNAGVFSTRIAYITKQGTRYELIVADADGGNPQGVVGRTSRSFPPPGRPTARGSRTSRSRTRSRSSMCSRSPPAAPGARELSRQQQRAGVVAGRPPARRHAVEGRRLADLHDQRRRLGRDASHQFCRHRYRGVVHARRRVAALHVGSRRHTANLSSEPCDQRRRTAHVRGQLQRVAARVARWQGLRVREARGRPLHARDPGLRVATSADADAGTSRRKPRGRAQFEAHHLRGAAGRPWYIGCDLLRRPREAAARFPAADVREPAWGPLPR